jgi:hypothetical protein
MEAARSSNISAPTYNITRCYKSENHNPNIREVFYLGGASSVAIAIGYGLDDQGEREFEFR